MEDTTIDVGDEGAFHRDEAARAGTGRAPGAAALDRAPEPGHLAELPRSLAEVTSVRDGNAVEHRLQLSPGATAAEVTAAMILMPPAAALAGDRAGADTVLVFHEPAQAAASTAVWPHGSEPPTADARSGDGDQNHRAPATRWPV